MADCPAWTEARRRITGLAGEPVTLESTIGLMLSGPDGWTAVASFCEKVMKKKEKEERARQAARPPATPDSPGGDIGRGRRCGGPDSKIGAAMPSRPGTIVPAEEEEDEDADEG